MNHLENKILNIAERVTQELGFLLIAVTVKGDNRNRILQIFVDSDKSLSADDCALVSGKIASDIENSDLISSKYRLEVSSPGIERPLKYIQQYPKNINRNFEVTYIADDEEVKKITGKLIKVEDNDLTFLVKGSEIKVNFNKIKIAKVLVSF